MEMSLAGSVALVTGAAPSTRGGITLAEGEPG
jgi:hypothetical protein